MTPEEIELLSELTVIILTYNRPLELERAIEYWRDTPVTLHIYDGSDNATFSEGMQHGTQRIFYHSFPRVNETTSENWSRRVKAGTGLITTKFAALSCDDDVLTVDGLINAVIVLNDGTCDAVAGKAGEYRIKDGKVNWIHKYPKSKDEKLQKSEKVSERLFASGAHAFYGVYKAEYLRKIHEIGNRYSFPVPVWHSMLIMVTIKILCKIKFLDDLFWLKSAINHPESRPIKFAQLFWDDKFVEYKTQFLYGMSEALQEADPKMTEGERDALIFGYHSRFARPKKRKKAEVKLKAQLLRALGKLPKLVRELVFNNLSGDLKKRLGNANFEVNFKPVVLLSEQDLMNGSLKKWETILLMPREELRLRANI